jgi:hypothetical protein
MASIFRALASWWKGDGDDRDGTTHGREKADEEVDGQTYSAVSHTDQVKQGGTRKRPLPPSYADLFGDEEDSFATQSRKRPAAQCQPKSVRLQPRQQKLKSSRFVAWLIFACSPNTTHSVLTFLVTAVKRSANELVPLELSFQSQRLESNVARSSVTITAAKMITWLAARPQAPGAGIL